jgi:hypothetical protein
MLRILVVVALAGLLAGCAARTHQEANAQRGAVVGGATGAAVGGLAGGTVGSALAGGLIGAAAGGLLGAAATPPPPPPPPPGAVPYPPEDCYVRTPSGRMRRVPCD